MTLSEIVEQFSQLRVYETRDIASDYQERVIYNEDFSRWYAVLQGLLGPPVKPAGAAPSPRDLSLSQQYGSIFENQVLFSKESGDGTLIAMFWPWMDGQHTTFKLCFVS